MIKKKAGKKAGKKAAKGKARKAAGKKREMDPGKVREEIVGLVREEAKAITVAVMDRAKHGQLPQAKYLFEVAKIFPPIEDGEERTPEEDSLAKMLMERLKPPRKIEGEDDEKVDESGGDQKHAADPAGKAETEVVQPVASETVVV